MPSRAHLRGCPRGKRRVSHPSRPDRFAIPVLGKDESAPNDAAAAVFLFAGTRLAALSLNGEKRLGGPFDESVELRPAYVNPAGGSRRRSGMNDASGRRATKREEWREESAMTVWRQDGNTPGRSREDSDIAVQSWSSGGN